MKRARNVSVNIKTALKKTLLSSAAIMRKEVCVNRGSENAATKNEIKIKVMAIEVLICVGMETTCIRSRYIQPMPAIERVMKTPVILATNLRKDGCIGTIFMA